MKLVPFSAAGFAAVHRAVVATAACLFPVNAIAQVPGELHNKSIVLSWNEVRVQRAEAGDVKRNTTSSRLIVYVSGGGRLFSSLSRRGSLGRGNDTNAGPDGTQRSGTGAGNLNPVFQGNQLNIVSTMQNGARNVQASFGAGFSRCSLRVLFGKEGGADIRHRAMDGRMYTILSTDVSSASCSIRAGNALGGGTE